MPQIGKGMTAEQARKLLGAPDHTSRQILYRRYAEQWTYDNPAGLWIELDCVKGQDPRVIGVHLPAAYQTDASLHLALLLYCWYFLSLVGLRFFKKVAARCVCL